MSLLLSENPDHDEIEFGGEVFSPIDLLELWHKSIDL